MNQAKRKGYVTKLFLGGLCFALLSACSLVLDFEECKQDEDCSDNDLICKKGYCVEKEIDSDDSFSSWWSSNECTRLYGITAEEAQGQNTFLLGSILPYSGDLSVYGPKIGQGVELAIDEINQAGGILGKKLGVVFCDSGTSNEMAKQAAEHLIELERIPAIIGPAHSDVVIDVFTEVVRDAGLVMISPSATSPMISSINDNNLLWRTAPSDAIQGAAIAHYLMEEGFDKIAIINRDDAYGNGLKTAITDLICNGDACSDGQKFYPRSYPVEVTSDEQNSIISELEAFDPDITILISFYRDGSGFLELASEKGIEQFVLPDGLRTKKLMTERNLSDGFLCRTVGTQPASPSGSNYLGFSLRFNGKYDEVGSYSANAYDAAYLISYAIAASGRDAPSGKDVAEGLTRLSSGEMVDAGTTSWNSASKMLSSDAEATIDYDGASGPLDFDENGEAPSDIEGWTLDLTNNDIFSLGTVFTHDGSYNNDLFDEITGQGDACDALRE